MFATDGYMVMNAVIVLLLGVTGTLGGMRTIFSQRRDLTPMQRIFWGWLRLFAGSAFLVFGVGMLIASR